LYSAEDICGGRGEKGLWVVVGERAIGWWLSDLEGREGNLFCPQMIIWSSLLILLHLISHYWNRYSYFSIQKPRPKKIIIIISVAEKWQLFTC
jgi:hypothetical protein